jgi:regulator of cell morphogenesis and NO signaling
MDFSTLTLGEVAIKLPGATEVFRKYDLDFCCSGHNTLKQAIIGNDALTTQVIEDLQAILPRISEEKPSDLPLDELIDYILINFHEKHRKELPELILLAQKVEAVHADKEDCPHGLAAQLETMYQEMVDHMRKEEMVLFPAIKNKVGLMITCPVEAMKAEHIEHGETLERLSELTSNYVVPVGACNTWAALINGVRSLTEDLTEHISLENNSLFPRALEEAANL